MPSVCPLAL